jgi:hypothetical protein
MGEEFKLERIVVQSRYAHDSPFVGTFLASGAFQESAGSY